MTTTTIGSFTVPVTFRGVAYDVEITPSMHGILFPQRINDWNSAEKTHQLFSKKIVEMLEDAVPADSEKMLTVGSKDGFEFADKTTTTLKTQALWGEFIDCLAQPATYTAGRPNVDDEELSDQEIGLDARLRLTHNVYSSLTPAEQQKMKFNVFQKKCAEHFCQEYNFKPSIAITYSEVEEKCLDVLLERDPSQPKTKPGIELRTLWNMENERIRKEMEERKKGRSLDLDPGKRSPAYDLEQWSLAYDRIGKQIAEAATKPAAAISDEESDLDLL